MICHYSSIRAWLCFHDGGVMVNTVEELMWVVDERNLFLFAVPFRFLSLGVEEPIFLDTLLHIAEICGVFPNRCVNLKPLCQAIEEQVKSPDASASGLMPLFDCRVYYFSQIHQTLQEPSDEFPNINVENTARFGRLVLLQLLGHYNTTKAK
eukprot:m.322069 g.322069  ORF g.322069 m.322069 type:complete len:152 (-) comp16002_c1_seq8:226-681(-)